MERRPWGSGSICLRKDGRWCGVITIGMTASKRKRVYVYGKTQDEVEEKLNALWISLPPSYRKGKNTVATFLYRWLDESVTLRNKPRTARGYRELVDNHIVPSIGSIPLKLLAPEHVQRMINELARTLAPNTVRNVRACLRPGTKSCNAPGTCDPQRS
jgi:integrase